MFFIEVTASDFLKMIPVVVFVVALAASGLSLPLTTQEHVPTENVQNVQQVLTEVPVAQFVEKTGVQGSPEVYSQVGQIQSITPVPKVENVPVVQSQAQYPENPVLLPIQPLSVGQAGQVLRPVIVPAEAITAGRVIIAGIETIQQRNFPQNEVVNIENPVPHQQVVHPVTYTPVQAQGVEPNQQPYYPQPNEKQTPVQQGILPTGQEYFPVQAQSNPEPLVKEQIVSVSPVQEYVEQVQNYNPVPVEHNQQVYSFPQNVQPVVAENAEKNAPYQVGSGYVPVQGVHQQVQNFEEKQVPYQQVSGYTPVQTQGVEPGNQYQTYSSNPVVVENVEKQVPHQQTTGYQQQVYNVQQGEKHGEYQQVSPYTPVQNQAVDQQAYNVQTVVEKQGHYQTQSVETQQHQVQTVEQGVQSQVPFQRVEPVEPIYQQQVYNSQPVHQIQPVQNYPVEPVIQQQIYSVQPVAVDQVESQVPYQPAVQQQTGYIPEQNSKTTVVEHDQSYVQPQVVNYESETAYNFGDKITQQQSVVQSLAAVPQTQGIPVQPSVVSPQE